jgi:secreted PhoX family phosphatase
MTQIAICSIFVRELGQQMVFMPETLTAIFTPSSVATHSSETTGLAFSPDKKHMYVSYQNEGVILDITREDGYPFGALRLDIKYHAP